MKYLICSDIHGSYHYLKRIIKIFDREKCDKLLILGDILYHGPRNHLPRGYSPKKVLHLLNNYKDKIISVKGNCDAEIDEMVLDFPLYNQYEFYDNGIFFMTHGHKVNPNNPIERPKNSFVLYGHTHVHLISKVNDVIYINPGSISLAKGDKINSFAVLDTNKITIYTLKMHKLLEYKTR